MGNDLVQRLPFGLPDSTEPPLLPPFSVLA
ncbi:MAG: hypothetical protein CM1200mP29_15050 [Verrucomicrobiota bacterium]|nr:MAG: hypothetical protein CM1200mP29_15050 [Verrucomicrobiota bacterium]